MCKFTCQTFALTLVFDDSHQDKVNFLLQVCPSPTRSRPPMAAETQSPYRLVYRVFLEGVKNCVEHYFLDRKSPQEGISEKAEKCDLHFFCFLMRCVVSDHQVGMDQQKIQAIIDWSSQSSPGDVHRTWSDFVSVGPSKEETEPDPGQLSLSRWQPKKTGSS